MLSLILIHLISPYILYVSYLKGISKFFSFYAYSHPLRKCQGKLIVLSIMKKFSYKNWRTEGNIKNFPVPLHTDPEPLCIINLCILIDRVKEYTFYRVDTSSAVPKPLCGGVRCSVSTLFYTISIPTPSLKGFFVLCTRGHVETFMV